MDEQMIEDMRDTIESSVAWQTGEVFKGNRQCVNYLEVARAAHSVMAGKVAELTEALREARIAAAADVEEAEDSDGRYHSFLPVFVERLAKVDAALAPHPKGMEQ